jgi:hypothetical protein
LTKILSIQRFLIILQNSGISTVGREDLPFGTLEKVIVSAK